MADRRMFSKTVVESDTFLDMPITARALYFHLGMQADDDGFVIGPKKVQRMAGCSDDDLKLLIAKGFLIPFDTGVVLVRHWKQNNWIRADRYKATVCQTEIAMVSTGNAGQYELGIPSDNQVSTSCQPDGIPSDNQVTTSWLTVGIPRVGENSIDKYSIGEVGEGDGSPATAAEAQTLESFAANNLSGFNAVCFEEFGEYMKDFPNDMIIYAIKEAGAHGKPYWAYVRKILQRWQSEHITTLEQAKLSERKPTPSVRTKGDMNYQQHEYKASDFDDRNEDLERLYGGD